MSSFFYESTDVSPLAQLEPYRSGGLNPWVCLVPVSLLLTSHFYRVPDYQRRLSRSHVADLFQRFETQVEKTETIAREGLLTFAFLHEAPEEIYLIDGQHRMKAYARLRKKYSEIDFHVLLEVHACETEKDMKEMYNRLNYILPPSFPKEENRADLNLYMPFGKWSCAEKINNLSLPKLYR